jgi:hypothetical protein
MNRESEATTEWAAGLASYLATNCTDSSVLSREEVMESRSAGVADPDFELFFRLVIDLPPTSFKAKVD